MNKLAVESHLNNNDVVIRDEEGDVVANCTVDTPEEKRDASKAMAILFAAAPEMLEALKEVSKILRTFKSSFSGGKTIIVEKINRVDGLIMKAEGREGSVRDF